MITYFISYARKPIIGSGLGFGCTTVSVEAPIMGDKDLMDLISYIKEKQNLHDHEVVPIQLTLLKKE